MFAPSLRERVLAAGVIFHSAAFRLGTVDLPARTMWDFLITFSVYPETIFVGPIRSLLFTVTPAAYDGFMPARLAHQPTLKHPASASGGAALVVCVARLIFTRSLRRCRSPFTNERWRALLGFAACCATLGCATSAARQPKSAMDVDEGPSASFELDGAPFCFVGANNYYLAYKPKAMVDNVLESARAMGAKVVRTWGFIDRGSLDGSVRSVDGDGTKDGFYFQAWDPAQQRAVYNDGPDGLQGLDYALAKAEELDLKIVLVLTNNWWQFGGMDQYLAWYGLSAHQDFYSDPRVKRSYKDWVWHLAAHVNRVTQRAYRDDPTIFAWELANEPRGNAGTASTVLDDWAGEMSGYIKSIDPQHLVAVGDEGFFEQPKAEPGASDHWTYRANNGVDHPALTALPNIDYGTFHMYPDTWGTGSAWPERWIDDHLRVARELGKPTVLEEYGLKVARDDLGRVNEGLAARLDGYRAWNERVLARGGNAAMFWILAGNDETGGLYLDYDHFSVYLGDQTSNLLRGFSKRFATARACERAAPGNAGKRSPFVRVRNYD